MREIKYRVYDNCDDDPLGMCPVHSIFWHSGTQYVSWAAGTCEAPITDVPVMQYTTMKDCNGVEIYEGDIVTAGDMVCVVEMGRTKWVAAWKAKLKGMGGRPDLGFRSHKVIGNIHENPELLGRE